MYFSDSNETIGNQVEIVGFDFETVKLALELIYGRQIPTLTMEQKMDILKFFDKYDVRKFKVGPPRIFGDSLKSQYNF